MKAEIKEYYISDFDINDIAFLILSN